MATRRWRRIGRHLQQQQSLLPFTRTTQQLPNSLSCWYCDWKVRALNGTLYSIGNRYARFLHVWFTMGVAVSLVALIGVVGLLIWELFGAFLLHNKIYRLNNLLVSWLFDTSLMVPKLSIWIMNAGVMFLSTSISVAVHEFGHGIAAASEGMQIEYIAIFLATIFPGALVALNHDLLQSLPRLSTLRIYCAGIWHNIMFCAACGIAFLLLPAVLHPLYVHSEMPMVLEVPETSPLSNYLSRGDVITAVDGSKIHSPSEWKDKMLNKAGTLRKGYCVPTSWLHGTDKSRMADSNLSCPDELTSFTTVPYFNLSLSNRSRYNNQCLSAKDVVKLKKCGDGWDMIGTNSSNVCSCSEEESCMMPVQIPGMSWVEISYSSSYSLECLQLKKNTSVTPNSSEYSSTACEETFVFVGNVFSLAYCIHLSSYQPRWVYITAYLPILLESILSCTYHVSATLAILNILPVYFLDGESILETCLDYITWLNPMRRVRVLRVCLIGGSIFSIYAFARILYSFASSSGAFVPTRC